jgi:hypothetical protein
MVVYGHGGIIIMVTLETDNLVKDYFYKDSGNKGCSFGRGWKWI